MFPQQEEEEEEPEEPDWNDPAVTFERLLKALDDKDYREVMMLTERTSNNIHVANGHDPWYGTTGSLPDRDVDHLALYACAHAARSASMVGGGTYEYYRGNELVVEQKRDIVVEDAARAAYRASEAKQDLKWVVARLFKELNF